MEIIHKAYNTKKLAIQIHLHGLHNNEGLCV